MFSSVYQFEKCLIVIAEVNYCMSVSRWTIASDERNPTAGFVQFYLKGKNQGGFERTMEWLLRLYCINLSATIVEDLLWQPWLTCALFVIIIVVLAHLCWGLQALFILLIIPVIHMG